MGTAVDVTEQSPGQPRRRLGLPVHTSSSVQGTLSTVGRTAGLALPCHRAAPLAGVCSGLALQVSMVRPRPQVRHCGRSSVSASICWTSTGSCLLLISLGASGILLAPFDCAHVILEMEIPFTHVWTARTFQRGTNALASLPC